MNNRQVNNAVKLAIGPSAYRQARIFEIVIAVAIISAIVWACAYVAAISGAF